MKPPKTLLLAVTHNPHDLHAARQGLSLAASMGATAIAVSVVPRLEGNMSLAYIRDHMSELQAPHRQALDAVRGLAAAMNVPCTCLLETGIPYEVIVDVAEARGADWIVLGEQHRTALGRMLVTPVAERVIGYSRRTVLTVPDNAEVGFGRILLCHDGSEYSQRAFLQALSLARSYGGSITAVNVVDVPAEYHIHDKLMQDLESKARKALQATVDSDDLSGVAVKILTPWGKTVASLLEDAENAKADLIVMGSHGRTGLRRLLMGSVAQQVLHSAPVPVLIVP